MINGGGDFLYDQSPVNSADSRFERIGNFKILSGASPELKRLVRKCLAKDPALRPRFSELPQHEFFKAE